MSQWITEQTVDPEWVAAYPDNAARAMDWKNRDIVRLKDALYRIITCTQWATGDAEAVSRIKSIAQAALDGKVAP